MKLIGLLRAYILFTALLSGALLIVDYGTLVARFSLTFEQILLFLIIVQILLATYTMIDAIRIDQDILSFRVVSQVIFLTYSVMTPIIFLIYGNDPMKVGYYLHENFCEENLIKVYYLFVLMQMGMVLGYNIKIRNMKLGNISLPTSRYNKLGWFLFLLSLIPYILLIAEHGWNPNLAYLDVFVLFKEQAIKNRLFLYLGFLTLLPMSWLIISSIYMRRWRVLLIIYIIILGITMIKPSRGLLLAATIIAVLAYHYLIRQITIKKAALIVVGFFCVSVLIVNARSAIQGNYYRSDIIVRASEGGGIFENTYIVYDYLERTGEYRWGMTYLNGILHLFPQWMLPIKKEDALSAWLLKSYFPIMYNKGAGRMFSVVAEAYMNFHVCGPVLIGMVFACCLKLLYITMRRSRASTTIGFLMYVFVCSQIYYFIRGDLMSFLVRMEALCLPPLILLIVLRSRKRRPVGNSFGRS